MYWVIASFAPASTLRLKFFQVGQRICQPGVEFRVSGDRNTKMVAGSARMNSTRSLAWGNPRQPHADGISPRSATMRSIPLSM